MPKWSAPHHSLIYICDINWLMFDFPLDCLLHKGKNDICFDVTLYPQYHTWMEFSTLRKGNG